jgi:hypothetical protein
VTTGTTSPRASRKGSTRPIWCTAGLSDEELSKKDISVPISNITLKLVTVEKK